MRERNVQATRRWRRAGRSWRPILGIFAAAMMAQGASSQAAVHVLPDMTVTRESGTITGAKAVRADPTMQEVLAAFDRAERALEEQDLSALMQFYAPGYNYHGLHVADVERIWGEVFEHYRTLSSTHLFAEMKILRAEEGLRVELTCTGGLYGADVQSGVRVTLDSWFQEVHYLVRDKQGWRFLGNRGDAPRSAPFSSSPHHPLF
ncbi:MAG: conserved exported protein of unknown function [Nitrospira sp.]|nr:hypothetical protein [Nitrospira sp.]ULA58603.1 MAG: conserved exported protein of unknown function [Nitrospira sp.]